MNARVSLVCFLGALIDIVIITHVVMFGYEGFILLNQNHMSPSKPSKANQAKPTKPTKSSKSTNGDQVDLPCKGGKTALMMACTLGREAVVQAGVWRGRWMRTFFVGYASRKPMIWDHIWMCYTNSKPTLGTNSKPTLGIWMITSDNWVLGIHLPNLTF